MTEAKRDNYRTIPAFNYEFDNLPECVASAVLEFTKRPAVIFLILRHTIRTVWLVMPWSQYRAAPAEHPCHASTIIFRGNLFDLRNIAYSFPPDLFSDPIFDAEDHRLLNQAAADNPDRSIGTKEEPCVHTQAAPASGISDYRVTPGNNGNGDPPLGTTEP